MAFFSPSPLSIIEVLSLMLRQRTPIDGMMRTMVITGETSKARTIVLPLWFIPQASKDVLRGTDIRADATLDAQPTVHNELFIGDKMLLEEAAKKPGVDTRPMPDDEVAGRSVVDDIVYIITQFGSSLVFLFLLLFSIVDIKKRQSEIRLWHDERKDGMERDILYRQILAKNIHGLTYVVTGSAEGIDIMPIGIHTKPADKLADNLRRAPAMDRKAETETLTFLQGKHRLPRTKEFGNEQQFVACGLGNCLGGPPSVACV